MEVTLGRPVSSISQARRSSSECHSAGEERISHDLSDARNAVDTWGGPINMNSPSFPAGREHQKRRGSSASFHARSTVLSQVDAGIELCEWIRPSHQTVY